MSKKMFIWAIDVNGHLEFFKTEAMARNGSVEPNIRKFALVEITPLDIDWNLANADDQWVAQDEKGWIYAFKNKPKARADYWFDAGCHLLKKGKPNQFWRDTLTKRPKHSI